MVDIGSQVHIPKYNPGCWGIGNRTGSMLLFIHSIHKSSAQKIRVRTGRVRFADSPVDLSSSSSSSEAKLSPITNPLRSKNKEIDNDFKLNKIEINNSNIGSLGMRPMRRELSVDSLSLHVSSSSASSIDREDSLLGMNLFPSLSIDSHTSTSMMSSPRSPALSARESFEHNNDDDDNDNYMVGNHESNDIIESDDQRTAQSLMMVANMMSTDTGMNEDSSPETVGRRDSMMTANGLGCSNLLSRRALSYQV